MQFNEEELEEYNKLKARITRRYPGYLRPESKYFRFISNCYNGCGLLMCKEEGYQHKKLYNCYDLNSAYSSALLTEKYPLSYKGFFSEIKPDTTLEMFEEFAEQEKYELYGIKVKFYDLHRKHKEFFYNVFFSNDGTATPEIEPDGKLSWTLYFTNIDLLLVHLLLQWSKSEVKEIYVFTDVGYMPESLTREVLKVYEEISELKKTAPYKAKQKKKMLEILTYGKNAQKDKNILANEGKIYRHQRVCVAAFQIAYVRKKMGYLFFKYMPWVKMIDTDCIVLSNSVLFKEYEKEKNRSLSYFKEEFTDKHFCQIVPKMYIVFDEYQKIVKSKFNGLKYGLNEKQLDELFENKKVYTVEDRTYKKEDGTKETRNIKIEVNWDFCLNTDPLPKFSKSKL